MQAATATTHDWFRKTLLYLIVAELALLGDGRLLTLGPLTGRMLLFLVAMGWACVQLLYGARLRSETILVTGCFSILMFFGILEGLLSVADPAVIFENVKPWSYFFMLLFFELAIRNAEDFETVLGILKYSGLLLAAMYLLVVILQLTGAIKPVLLYEFLSTGPTLEGSQEFMGRFDPGTGVLLFTYKGFLYLCVAAILWAYTPGWRKFYSLVCGAAVLLTLVRGYFLGLIAAFLVYFVLFEKRLGVRIAAIALLAVGSTVALTWSMSYRSDTNESDLARWETINQVFDRETIASTFTGYGLGVGVPIRKESMEITYLQVFHQQGIVGLCFWAYFFSSTTYYAWKTRRPGRSQMETALYLLCVLVFLITSTNPVLNNPIGMGVILVSFVILRKDELQSTSGAVCSCRTQPASPLQAGSALPAPIR